MYREEGPWKSIEEVGSSLVGQPFGSISRGVYQWLTRRMIEATFDAAR